VREEDGSVDTYTYQWYREDGSAIVDSIRNLLTGMRHGIYSISAINTVTQCESIEQFEIVDDSKVPIVNISTSPVTNCDPAFYNGEALGFVSNSLYGNFQESYYLFNWFEGAQGTGSPTHNGQLWTDLAPGTYTLVVTDNQLQTCISDPVTVEITGATVNPELTITEINPLTNCDPEKANSAFKVLADGKTGGYLFEWFDENGELHFAGPNPTNLSDQTYQLSVKNLATGCISSAPVHPSISPDIIPNPDVEIIRELTSCLMPNGMATATVNGNIVNYIFRYYDFESSDELTNYFDNNIIYDLEVGNYSVTAENRNSGCISEPTPFSIADDRYYPEIHLLSTPSSCEDPTGGVEVIIEDLTMPFQVDWYDEYDNKISSDQEVFYLPVGYYTVEVEGTEGCFSEDEIEVKGDIIIYNGISANEDGLNDYFQIVCLEFFPDNNVQIFNRSGVLVYEMTAYDMHNPDRRFDGVSNRGMSLGQDELPIGTYFYRVDKNDGSEPKVGYLELKR
jgi:gliding motility-associated-like protein